MPYFKDLTPVQKEKVEAVAEWRGQTIKQCYEDIRLKALVKSTGPNKA